MSATKKAKGARAERAKQARKELGDLPAQFEEVAKLKGQPLIDRYTEVLGRPPKSKNQQHLRKRIAIELQLKAKGGITEEERAQIKKVQDYALAKGIWPDVRKGETRAKGRAEQPTEAAPEPSSQVHPADPRLPHPGSLLRKQHGNETHEVKVLAEGFEYRGETYRSLSKIARVITGTTWNGFLFFNLVQRKAK